MGRQILRTARLDTAGLWNTYLELRHGKSNANEEELIISDPRHGTIAYGLVDEGRREVRCSARQALQQKLLDHTAIVFSSDFLRAVQSTEIAASVLGIRNIEYTPLLRERSFGEFEGAHNSNYERVWALDRKSSRHKRWGVESVDEVLARTRSLIEELELRYRRRTILLVSHGDTLQILQTDFDRVDPRRHRKISPLKTGEIRQLNWI